MPHNPNHRGRQGLPVLSLAVPLLLAGSTLRADDPPVEQKAERPEAAATEQGDAGSEKDLVRALADGPDEPRDVTKLMGEMRLNQLSIESVLDKPIDVEFVDTPLRDAIAFLRDFYQIEILLDEATISESADPQVADTPIDLVLSNVQFQSLLHLIFEQVPTEKLTWVIEDEVMKITTVADAESRYEVHVYDIEPLAQAGYAPDVLKSLLETTVRPKSWCGENSDASIAVVPGGLIVRQTPLAHREVLDVLKQLYKLTKYRALRDAARPTVPRFDNHSQVR